MLPRFGLEILPLESTFWRRRYQKTLNKTFEINEEKIKNESKKNRINYLKVNTNQDYIPSLIKLFKTRNRYNWLWEYLFFFYYL